MGRFFISSLQRIIFFFKRRKFNLLYLIMIKTLLFTFLFFPLRIFSQSMEIFKPDSVRKQVIATKINSSLHIDGVLNEPEWLRANASPRFTQIEPFQGAAPGFETDVKVL